MNNLQNFTGDTNQISQLDDKPIATGGLTADQLKAKFDEAPTEIKSYINEFMVTAINALISNLNQLNINLLSTYSQTEENLSDAVSKKHSHENKDALDKIADNKIDEVLSNVHKHDNKDILDSYTQTEENISSAVSQKHSHENKELLDDITAENLLSSAETQDIAGDKLFSGKIILSSESYGDALPDPGIPGRIFFKKV